MDFFLSVEGLLFVPSVSSSEEAAHMGGGVEQVKKQIYCFPSAMLLFLMSLIVN